MMPSPGREAYAHLGIHPRLLPAWHAWCSQRARGLWRQGCKRPYVAYFGAAGVGGRAAPHAWLSRSTHGLRARLAAPPNCLDFTLPLAGAAGAAETRMAAELPELGQARTLQRSVAHDICRLPARTAQLHRACACSGGRRSRRSLSAAPSSAPLMLSRPCATVHASEVTGCTHMAPAVAAGGSRSCSLAPGRCATSPTLPQRAPVVVHALLL
jgi:hypothetical protein